MSSLELVKVRRRTNFRRAVGMMQNEDRTQAGIAFSLWLPTIQSTTRLTRSTPSTSRLGRSTRPADSQGRHRGFRTATTLCTQVAGKRPLYSRIVARQLEEKDLALLNDDC